MDVNDKPTAKGQEPTAPQQPQRLANCRLSVTLPTNKRSVTIQEMAMGEWVQIASTKQRGYLATPDKGTGPGILVLHAWWGLTPDFIAVCDRLAENGFVALAPALYLGEATASTIPEAEALLNSQDEEAVVGPIVHAAATQLRNLPQVAFGPLGVIGFSMGAYWALNLAQAFPDEFGAVVAIYGTNDGDFTASNAAFLGHFAEQDEYEPLESVQALEARIRDAAKEGTFHIYPGTKHWFFEPSRPEYDAAAAELVWQRTLTFLHHRVG
jgi:carboxymethylenebutenolidase